MTQRRVDDLGRVVLPLQTRQELGILPKELLELSVEDGAIVLRKSNRECYLCHAECDGQTPALNGHKVCPECITRLLEQL